MKKLARAFSLIAVLLVTVAVGIPGPVRAQSNDQVVCMSNGPDLAVAISTGGFAFQTNYQCLCTQNDLVGKGAVTINPGGSTVAFSYQDEAGNVISATFDRPGHSNGSTGQFSATIRGMQYYVTVPNYYEGVCDVEPAVPIY
jgi:hypothetical protein